MVEQLNRENKRLQVSLKEMVATNRLLRDQNKSLTNEVDVKDKRIEELNIAIKTVD